MTTLSIVLPAKNEEINLRPLVQKIRKLFPDAELLVIDDGSTDNTREICLTAGAIVISHPYSKGNGAAIKTGARHAKGDVIVFMDGDGQHNPDDIHRLLSMLDEGYDMVVGARSNESQASHGRALANSVYNTFSSWVTGQQIKDLTSGFRIVKADKFREFLYLLPNGFSYPTTSTMAFFRAGYSVGYIPIVAGKREGKSHINLTKDGVRFLLIIFKIGTLYSPLKIFAPFSLLFFLTGALYYGYTYIDANRFTNMSALLLSISVVIFLIGLVSEQVTSLLYSKGTE
jgi:glycosyltransferase involved in cell wall biosynthesis